MKKTLLLFLLCVLFVPSLAFARLGVGVGTAKIIVDKDLKAGTIYSVPPVTILNTGDEPSDYELLITYHSDQQEIWPDREWFEFSPSSFHLEPGEAQIVNVRLDLPIKAKPGNYFAFIEGHPVQKASGGGTTVIGIAAATKFYFTIAPSNIFEAIYYRLITFFDYNAPWSYIILAVVLVAVLWALFKKFFKFKLNIKIDKK